MLPGGTAIRMNTMTHCEDDIVKNFQSAYIVNWFSFQLYIVRTQNMIQIYRGRRHPSTMLGCANHIDAKAMDFLVHTIRNFALDAYDKELLIVFVCRKARHRSIALR